MLETVKTRLHQAREWLLDYAYLVTLGAMIAVIAGTALYTDHLRSQQNVQGRRPRAGGFLLSHAANQPHPRADACAHPHAVRGRFRSPRLRQTDSRLLLSARILAGS